MPITMPNTIAQKIVPKRFNVKSSGTVLLYQSLSRFHIYILNNSNSMQQADRLISASAIAT